MVNPSLPTANTIERSWVLGEREQESERVRERMEEGGREGRNWVWVV